MTKETIKIDGMSCNHCVASVTGALTALSGVESAEVSLEDKSAVVTYDESAVTRKDMTAAIEELGFDAE